MLWRFVPHPEIRTVSLVVTASPLVDMGFRHELFEVDQRTGHIRATVRGCRRDLTGAAVANGIVCATASYFDLKKSARGGP